MVPIRYFRAKIRHATNRRSHGLGEMSKELLTQESVIPYLKSRGLIDNDSMPEVEVLTGGVSNSVFAVQQGVHDLVLKQALPELKVKTLWVADQRRAIVEAKATQAYQKFTPENVPNLIDYDPNEFTLVIARAPRSCTNWREDLLAGNIQVPIASQLGEILGIWHRESAQDRALLAEFAEDSLFEQLRITPFYRAIGKVHIDIGLRMTGLIEELGTNKSALVHGDFSPKNILIDNDKKAIVLDFEVAHTGNPIFDLAFLMGHLLCKFFYFQERKQQEKIFQSAQSFLVSYENTFGAKASPTLIWHIAAIALARVDGVSIVHYLSEESRIDLRTHALAVLKADTPTTLTGLFKR